MNTFERTVNSNKANDRPPFRLNAKGAKVLAALCLVVGGLVGHYSGAIEKDSATAFRSLTGADAPSPSQLARDPQQKIIVEYGQGAQAVVNEVDPNVNEATQNALEQYIAKEVGYRILQPGDELNVPKTGD